MTNNKICTVCGSGFFSRGTRAYYCPECKAEAYQKVAERKQFRYIEKRRNRAAQERRKKRTTTAPELHEINQRAKAAGMTYGQYQAQLYQERHKMPGRL